MKQIKFRVQENTDTVDIDSKCLGLNAWVVGDSQSILNTNRGLSIQIRHNRDKATFEAANQLSKLLASAPELLETLKKLYAAKATSTAMLNPTYRELTEVMEQAASLINKLEP